MNGIEIFIIPLIALAVWILQYVFKAPDDNKQQNRPRGPSAPRTAVNKPKRQVSDLDRFLEETRKRKQDEERKPVVLAEVASDQPPADRGEAVERERKATSRPRQEPKPPRPSRQERKQRAQAAAPEPRRQPLVQPLREQPALVEVVPGPVLPPPPPLPAEQLRPARMAAVPATRPRQESIVLVELVRMLRNPRGAAMAMVLREIFDTPVSQRRG